MQQGKLANTFCDVQEDVIRAVSKSPALVPQSSTLRELPIIDSNASGIGPTPTGLAPGVPKGAARSKPVKRPASPPAELPELPADGRPVSGHH